MNDLINRQAALNLAKDICVPTEDWSIYRHRCIDPDEITCTNYSTNDKGEPI